MDASTHATESALANNLVQVVVVLDVVLVGQVELLRVQFDAVRLVWRVVCSVLEQILEVLPAERDKLFWLLADNFLYEVLQDSREGIRNFNLLSCENSHLAHV